MNGIWVLSLLIIAAALPAIIVFFWFRARKSPVTLPWFLTSLAAGIISLLVAALIQSLFPPSVRDGLGPVFFGIFVRIALVEEISRFVTLIPLIKAGNRNRNMDLSFAASLGFAAGLGFSVIESAFHGMADINITLLRAFTAAPLHGACGIRAGAVVFLSDKRPMKAIFLFVSAVFIHGAYNLTIINPALPSVLSVLIALAALFTTLSYIKAEMYDKNSFFPTQGQP